MTGFQSWIMHNVWTKMCSRVSMYIDGHKDGILFNLNSWKKWVICRKIVQNGTFLLKLVLTEEIRKKCKGDKKNINTEIITLHCSYRCLLIPTSCWFKYQVYAVSDSVIIFVCNICLHRHVDITSFRIWCNVCAINSLLNSKWLVKS